MGGSVNGELANWSPEGRESLEAVAVAGAVLALMAVGEPFWRAVIREIWPGRRHTSVRGR